MLTKTLSEAKKKQRISLIKAMNNDIGSIDSAKDSWNPAQISERAKDISYIRSLVDTWNPAQLNEALKMLDLPVIDTWNPAQIEEQRRNLVFYLVERTLTGNPITLNILGNLTPEITGLKVTMNPIQSGSGDPSPTNIRPISGRTESSVTRTAGEDVETKTHQYSETIYGGVDDFVNGGADSTKKYIELDENSNWDVGAGAVWFYIGGDSDLPTGTIIDSRLCSNMFKNGYNQDNSIWVIYKQIHIRPNSTIAPSGATAEGLAEFKNWLSTNNYKIQVCVDRATPATISTSAEEITLLKGENVLSTDGDSIELKYKQNF